MIFWSVFTFLNTILTCMWRQLQIWGHFYLFFSITVVFQRISFHPQIIDHLNLIIISEFFVCLIHSMNFCWKTSFLILFFNKLIKLEFITFILKFIRNFLSHLFSNGIFVLFISICSDGVFFLNLFNMFLIMFGGIFMPYKCNVRCWLTW